MTELSILSVGRYALLAQLATTLPLVGLIWIVQIVLYPQFAHVGAAEFPAYHAAHSRTITWVVGPLMVGELGASIASVNWMDPLLPRSWALLGLVLVFSAWGATAFVSVPLHDTLASGFSARAHSLLVATNWLRTAIWTLRGGLLVWAVSRGR